MWLKRLNDAFVEGGLELSEFKELKNLLVERKAETEQKLTVLEKGKTGRLEPVRNWIIEANQDESRISEENWSELKSFLKNTGSNRFLLGQTLTGAFKNPWNYVAETTVAAQPADSE